VKPSRTPARPGVLPALIVPLLLLSACTSTVRETDVIGRYEICLMGCKVIDIRADHTFRYQPMGDVGRPPEVTGTWRLLSNGLIEAQTKDQPWRFPHEERTDRQAADVVIEVACDRDSMCSPDAVVHVEYVDGSSQRRITDENGRARFPAGRVQRILLEPIITGYMGADNTAEYEVQDRKSNRFVLTYHWVPFFVHDLWLVVGDRLYTVEHFPMERVE
jgi:hypothetical protein